MLRMHFRYVMDIILYSIMYMNLKCISQVLWWSRGGPEPRLSKIIERDEKNLMSFFVESLCSSEAAPWGRGGGGCTAVGPQEAPFSLSPRAPISPSQARDTGEEGWRREGEGCGRGRGADGGCNSADTGSETQEITLVCQSIIFGFCNVIMACLHCVRACCAETMTVCVLMRDERRMASKVKQTTQHTQGSHFSVEK